MPIPKILDVLKKSQLFSRMDESCLDKVVAATTWRTATKGEMLFHEGDVAAAFFVVGKGKVKVFKLSVDGKEQILLIAGVGDTFAEAALFSGGRYPASAQALEDCELLVVHRDRFMALLRQDPDLALSLIARLSELLRKLASLVEGLALADVTTRLAHYLVGVARETGEESDLTIMLPEKKSVLASQLGTIPETLSRSLAKLSKDGIIRVNGSRICILDYERLKGLTG